jgi:hypothetical protein
MQWHKNEEFKIMYEISCVSKEEDLVISKDGKYLSFSD